MNRNWNLKTSSEMFDFADKIRKYWRFNSFAVDYLPHSDLIIMSYKGDRFHINKAGNVDHVYVDYNTGAEISESVGRFCTDVEMIHSALRNYDYAMFRENVFAYVAMICREQRIVEFDFKRDFVLPLRAMGFDVTHEATKEMGPMHYKVKKIDNWVFRITWYHQSNTVEYKFLEERVVK